MRVLVVVLVVTVIVAVVIALETTMVRGVYRSIRQTTPRVEHGTLGSLVESFVGGARSINMNASYPLVRLDFHQYGVRVHGAARVLDAVILDWQSLYSDIVGAERVVGKLVGSNGLRLLCMNSTSWVIFWTQGSDIDGLLARFASVGVAVSPAPQRVSFWTGLDT